MACAYPIHTTAIVENIMQRACFFRVQYNRRKHAEPPLFLYNKAGVVSQISAYLSKILPMPLYNQRFVDHFMGVEVHDIEVMY